MKKLKTTYRTQVVTLLLAGFSVLTAAPAQSEVVDRDDDQKTIAWHPTPVLELSILGADEADLDQAVLMVSLNYQSPRVQQELDALRAANAGYQVITLGADSLSRAATLEMPEIGAKFGLSVRASQYGPFINTTLAISKSQVQYLQKVVKQGRKLSDVITLALPVVSDYLVTKVVESYRIEQRLCDRVPGGNVRSVMRGLMDFARPREIRHNETYQELKRLVVEKCFTIETPADAASDWKTLLNTAVGRAKLVEPLIAEFTQRTSVRKQHTVVPALELTIN